MVESLYPVVVHVSDEHIPLRINGYAAQLRPIEPIEVELADLLSGAPPHSQEDTRGIEDLDAIVKGIHDVNSPSLIYINVSWAVQRVGIALDT